MIRAVEGILRRLGRERAEAERVAQVVRVGVRTLFRTQIPRMAAALAFRTLFSLVPVLVVGLVTAGAALSDEDLEARLGRLLEYLNLDELAAADEAAPLQFALGDAPADDGSDRGLDGTAVAADGVADQALVDSEVDVVGAGEESVVPADSAGDAADPAVSGEAEAAAQARIDEFVRELVVQVKSVPLTAIGLVGLLVLVYGALAMLVELERAFNQIYSAPEGRPWTRRIAIYWTSLTLGVILLFGAFAVGDWISRIASRAGFLGSAGIGTEAIQVAINILINFVLLMLAYLVVPNARVHLRPAAVGALLAGIVWEIGKYGFTVYVTYFTGNLSRIYGAIAVLPIFMLWVYLTWVVVLFGLQVSYALQSFKTWTLALDEPAGGGGPGRRVDPACGLVAMVAVVRRFAEGTPATIESVAVESDLDERTALAVLTRFESAGLVRRVAEADEEERAYVPGRPASMIPAAEVMGLMRRMSGGIERGGEAAADEGQRSSGDAAAMTAVTRELEAAEAGVLAGRSLAELAGVGDVGGSPGRGSESASEPGSGDGSTEASGEASA